MGARTSAANTSVNAHQVTSRLIWDNFCFATAIMHSFISQSYAEILDYILEPGRTKKLIAKRFEIGVNG
jgi:hypothetical protein